MISRMGRWDPDASGRLQYAAMALYLSRGYDDVTTAQIAEHAGLTKRSYFRYFADKREVIFAGAAAFEADVVAAVTAAPGDMAPIEAVIGALSAVGAQLEQYRAYTRGRRDLIASSTDLRERELIKMASLASAVGDALRAKGVKPLQATLAAQASVGVFTTAYDRWADADGQPDFPALVRDTHDELRRAVCG